MKAIVFVAISFFLSITTAFAQHFEWASSGSNLLTGYNVSCVTSDGRLIAGMQYEQPSYQISADETEIIGASGKGYPVNRYTNQFLLTCYDADGSIKWLVQSSNFSSGARILGVSSFQDGSVIVAFRSYQINHSVQEMGSDGNVIHLYDYEGKIDFNSYTFFAEINERGDIRTINAVKGIVQDDCLSFQACPDRSMIITFADSERIDDGKGGKKDVGHNYIQKISKDFKLDWTYRLKYLDKSCCSYFQNPSIAAVGKDGDIYISGNFRDGILPDGGKPHTAVVLDVVSQYNPAYESYVARLSATGKLKWVKYSEGKSLIDAISVNDKQVVISGKINLQKKLFGMSIDTTDKKKAFIESFDLNGNPKWVNTYNAITVNALSQDWEGNIYGAFRNQRSRGVPPLMIGRDSVPDAYERVIVASFDENGKYRWYKMSRAMLSIDSHARVHNDECGNLYFTGEMWYVLPVNMSLFDGAIVRGKGYGGAPLAARIRTTIPDELLSINVSLQQSIPIRLPEKDPKKPTTGPVSTPQKGGIGTAAAPVVKPDSVHSGRCVPIPFPWRLELFPNPTDGAFTARATISYSDNKVGLELWDVKGAFIRQLSPVQLRETGSFDMACDINDLAAGLYIVVLKGSGAAVTERLIKK
jgi:hypothetical protein